MNQEFGLFPDRLLSETEMELGKSTEKYLSFGNGRRSQVIIVNSEGFLSFIDPRNQFNIAHLPKTSIAKIFDPFWRYEMTQDLTPGETHPKVFQKAYQHAIDYCVREVKAYLQLGKLMGDVVPWVFAYGRLSDKEVSVGKFYIRCTGPYILLENLESQRDPNFKKEDVTQVFIEKKIIPLFRRLHAANVLHNAINFENLVITRDKQVKIINFSHSEVTGNPESFENEIRNIYSYFFY